MASRIIPFNGLDLTVEVRDEADASVLAEIFSHREYRAAEEVIQKAKSPVVDVGAHAGFFTLYARALNPKVKIVALEPEARNLAALRSSLKINKITGVTVVEAALGGFSGEGELAVSADSHNHSLIDSSTAPIGGSAGVQEVAVLTFADFRKKNKLKKISLVKMDIEGGEYGVFSALTPDDFACIGALIMEYHDQRNQTHKDIEQQLREHGFGVQIFPSKFDKKMGFLWAVNKARR